MNGQRKEAPHLVEEVYNLEDALVVGGLIISLLRHSNQVRVACFAQLINDIAPLVTNAGALKYCHGQSLDLIVESENYEVPEIGSVPYIDVGGTFDSETRLDHAFV